MHPPSCECLIQKLPFEACLVYQVRNVLKQMICHIQVVVSSDEAILDRRPSDRQATVRSRVETRKRRDVFAEHSQASRMRDESYCTLRSVVY